MSEGIKTWQNCALPIDLYTKCGNIIIIIGGGGGVTVLVYESLVSWISGEYSTLEPHP